MIGIILKNRLQRTTGGRSLTVRQIARSSDNCPVWSKWTRARIPRIKGVTPIGNLEVLVRFENGAEKTYDCLPLLSRPEFHLLKVPAFFRAVRVDTGGYGISWNDDVDLSEYELWTNGKPVADETLKRTP